jgi:hypothetical protein
MDCALLLVVVVAARRVRSLLAADNWRQQRAANLAGFSQGKKCASAAGDGKQFDGLWRREAVRRPMATGSNTGLWSRPGNIFEKVSAQLRDEIAGIPQYWRNFGRNFIPSVRREFFDDEPKSRFQKVLGWVWLVAFVAFLVCVNTPSIRRSWGMPEEATSAPTPALSHVPAGTPSSTPHHAKHHHSTE